MELQMSIRLGDLVTAATAVVSVTLAYSALRERLKVIETMVTPMWQQFLKDRQS